MFKTTFKDSKVQNIRNYGLNASMSVFLDITEDADFWCKNADPSRTQEVCHII